MQSEASDVDLYGIEMDLLFDVWTGTAMNTSACESQRSPIFLMSVNVDTWYSSLSGHRSCFMAATMMEIE